MSPQGMTALKKDLKKYNDLVTMKEQDEPSPILKKWRNVYLLVIGVLVVVIVSLYLFMQHYK